MEKLDKTVSEIIETRKDLEDQAEAMADSYADAFARWPWNEVSQCMVPAKSEERCPGGFSPLALGELCVKCNMRVESPAYRADKTVQRFGDLYERGAEFAIEKSPNGEFLVATIGVIETADSLWARKYADVPAMQAWLELQFPGDTSFMWLEDTWADLRRRPRGNLWNRKGTVETLARRLGQNKAATRTIQPAIVRKTQAAFGERCQLYTKYEEIPDRRDFLVIDLPKEEA